MDFSPIEPICRRNLLKFARAYQKAVPQKNGKPNKLSTISKYCRGDPRFFETLEAQEAEFQRVGGRTDNKGSVTLRIYDDVVSWFKAHWPSGMEYPMLENIIIDERTLNGATQEISGREKAPQAEGGKGKTGSNAGDLLAKLRRVTG